METYRKILRNHFGFGVFSVVLLACTLLRACCYDVQADYSFHNHLKEDVQLFVYASGPNLSENKTYLIKSEDYAMLASLKTCDRGGFGNVIVNEIDSVRLIVSANEVVIAIWRNSGEYYLHEDYRHLPDFFDWFVWDDNRLQHGSGHAEYRYFLESAEK
jgi:hypothetical protein